MQNTSIPIQFLNRFRQTDETVWHSPNDMANATWHGIHPWTWRNNDHIEELLGTPTYNDPGSTDSTLSLTANKLSNHGQQQAKNTSNKIQHPGFQATRDNRREYISKNRIYNSNCQTSGA
jgi:hypothetical protein